MAGATRGPRPAFCRSVLRQLEGGMIAGGGIGTLLLAAVVYFLGGDPSIVLDSQPPTRQAQPAGPGQNDAGREFVGKILGSTEDTWNEEFKKRGREYPEPTLVLF